jgi:hypothetical protein
VFLSALIGTFKHSGRLRGHSDFTIPPILFDKNSKRRISHFDYITKSKVFFFKIYIYIYIIYFKFDKN